MRAAPPEGSRLVSHDTTDQPRVCPRHPWAEAAVKSLQRTYRPVTALSVLSETLRLFDAVALMGTQRPDGAKFVAKAQANMNYLDAYAPEGRYRPKARRSRHIEAVLGSKRRG